MLTWKLTNKRQLAMEDIFTNHYDTWALKNLIRPKAQETSQSLRQA